MKPIAFIIPFALVATLAIAAVPPIKNVTFEWDYPIQELNATNLVFKLYTTKTPELTNSWTFYSAIPGDKTNAVVAVDPSSARYYYLTASNVFWGVESDPSNVVLASAWPKSGVLSIKRGP